MHGIPKESPIQKGNANLASSSPPGQVQAPPTPAPAQPSLAHSQDVHDDTQGPHVTGLVILLWAQHFWSCKPKINQYEWAWPSEHCDLPQFLCECSHPNPWNHHDGTVVGGGRGVAVTQPQGWMEGDHPPRGTLGLNLKVK